MRRMLDLFSGLKGASAAFEEAGWEVVHIDNNPDLEPDMVLDLSKPDDVDKLLLKYPPGHFELIWASPPCIEFYQVRAVWFDNYGEPPDMGLVKTAMRIITELNPTVWVLENTISGTCFIKHLLGDWRQRFGPFYLWGNFAYIANVIIPENHKAANDVWSTVPLRSNIKAKIPIELSAGLLESINNQQTLPI